MNPHFGPGPYTPLPSPDGLARAFRAADRRRLRNAMLAATMPVLVAFALATPSGIDGRAGLEPAGQPGQGGTASPTPSARPTAPAPPTQPDGLRDPHRLGGPSAVPSPSGDAAPGTAGASLRLPSDAKALVFAGNGMSVATFTVTEKFSLRADQLTHSGGGTTYGFYVESYDMRTRVGAVHLPGQGTSVTGWTTTNAYGALVPGRYRVFLIGSGPTWVSVPFTEKRAGFTVLATQPTKTLLRSDSGVRPGTSASAETRLALPVPDRRAFGFMFGRTSGGVAVSRTLVCVTLPSGRCDSTTAAAASTLADAARKPVNATFQVTSGQRREVVARAELADPASHVQVSATYLLIYL